MIPHTNIAEKEPAGNQALDAIHIMVYTIGEVIRMTTAKVFTTGRSQAVRLPKEFRFTGDEVNVTRIGDLIVLCPKGREDEIFFSSLGNFTDDFYESVTSARKELLPETSRESL